MSSLYGDIADYYEQVAEEAEEKRQEIRKRIKEIEKYKELEQKYKNLDEEIKEICKYGVRLFIKNNMNQIDVKWSPEEKKKINKAEGCKNVVCSYEHDFMMDKIGVYVYMIRKDIKKDIEQELKNNLLKMCKNEMNYIMKQEMEGRLKEFVWSKEEIDIINKALPCKYKEKCKFNHNITIEDVVKQQEQIRKKHVDNIQ